MAEGFLAYVDKAELEIEEKPVIEVITSKKSSAHLDVKDNGNLKDKHRQKTKTSGDKEEKSKGFLDFIEEDPKEKIEVEVIRRAPSKITPSTAVGFLDFVEEGKYEAPPEIQKISSKPSSRNVSRRTSRQSVDPIISAREEEISNESQRSNASKKSDKLKHKKSKKDKLK